MINKLRRNSILYSILLMMKTSTLMAGEADVVEVSVRYNGNNSFQIITTVKHADTGWDHYANAWEILDEEGNLIGKRVLYHPHVNEQPFTRSHTLTIPANVKRIRLRASDSVHGFGGEERIIHLQR